MEIRKLSQKLAAFWALTIIFIVISTVGTVLFFDPYDFAELIGGVLAPLLLSISLSLITGFIGGAVKKGLFREVFFWSYFVFLPLSTLAMILGGVKYG